MVEPAVIVQKIVIGVSSCMSTIELCYSLSCLQTLADSGPVTLGLPRVSDCEGCVLKAQNFVRNTACIIQTSLNKYCVRIPIVLWLYRTLVSPSKVKLGATLGSIVFQISYIVYTIVEGQRTSAVDTERFDKLLAM